MKKTIIGRLTALVLCVLMSLALFAGCQQQTASPDTTATPTAALSPDATPTADLTANNSTTPEVKTPKYIFLFIGDGMSYVQVNAAQTYLGNNKSGEVAEAKLNFTQFPVVGNCTTYDATSFCPDSASTGTSLSCGIKTHSGVIGLEVDKSTQVENISEILVKKGMKIGIVSSVTINHATPAAFYAHVPSRNDYYDIALQLADSDVDYFGGGTISKPTGDGTQTDAYEIIKSKGYTVAKTKEEILALNSSSGKVYAVNPKTQDSGSMPYAIDSAAGDLSLADYVKVGINVLDNDKGFFMMCESGKIDWACHANDAMTALKEVIAYTDAIQVAIDFAKEHPEETLIIVTGDHETGGMSIGYAVTGYGTAFDLLDKQKMSYVAFDSLIADMKKENPSLTLSDVLPVIKENFGLIAPSDPDAAVEANAPYVMTDYEYAKLETGFAQSMLPKDQRLANDEAAALYGGYDPLSVTVTHIINNKAGIGWTSYSHTGTPVAVYAMGVGAELFAGNYDNTDIFFKLLEVSGN